MGTFTRPARWLAVLLVSVAVACGDTPGPSSEGQDAGVDSATPPPADPGTPPPPDPGTPPPPDPGTPPPPDPGTPADPEPSGGGLAGTVTRSASPMAGGVGNLYVAVFDRDPIAQRDSAVVVANTLVAGVDMSSSGASVEYAVGGIPPRAEPYFVIAFLDDNGTVDASDPAHAGPDRGDLVSLDGFAAPRVTVSTSDVVAHDIVLNFNLPF